MNRKVITQWVGALRSGKYPQGRGSLRTMGDKFCCLGVLCELAAEARIIPQPRVQSLGTHYVYGENIFYYLPTEVSKWAGIPLGLPAVSTSGLTHDLARLNDDGAAFDTIADLIQQTLDGTATWE